MRVRTSRDAPFFVRRAKATGRVRPQRCQQMVLMYVSSGAVEVHHDYGAVHLSEGAMAFLPAGQAYWGGSASFVETITVYARPEFAREQVRWLPHSASFFEWLFRLPTLDNPSWMPPKPHPHVTVPAAGPRPYFP